MIAHKKLDILYFDGIAGLLAGLTLFSFQSWFYEIYSLPLHALQFITAANILYGICALLLAFKRTRSLLAIKVLAIANCFWVIVCIFFIFEYINSASWIGISLLIFESIFVGYLAYFECINSASLIYGPTYKQCVKNTYF
ncbi:hypothetical protein EU510_09160 [Pseudoalteromonas sp. FUC4]|uniref:hypothetical protein n=1 Tax=Pseudoalteromonas sp. FUC4 TaxID=2511201 RepID=UPI0011F3C576|nr:hypothetical protein [Pseudoalteromonas sp. FUC4]KAA1153946.1 hypothetical protein EU510_09160 [Pseudoalteromonas sp. FUC4]